MRQEKGLVIPDVLNMPELRIQLAAFIIWGPKYTPSSEFQRAQETPIRFLGREDPLEKGMATTLAFWPGEFHGQKSLAAYM